MPYVSTPRLMIATFDRLLLEACLKLPPFRAVTSSDCDPRARRAADRRTRGGVVDVDLQPPR